VAPATTTLTAVGATQQFTAEARDASGTVVPVTAFEWASSAPDVVTINPVTGLATAVAQGTATISAGVGSVTGTASLGVNLTPSVASIVVAPGTVTLTAVAATQQFTAVARDANGNVLPGVQFSWATGSAEVANVDPVTGIARAVGHGATTVTATAGTIAGSATLTVNLTATIASVVVTPATFTLTAVGTTTQFTAEARDVDGAPLPGVPVTWSSLVTNVATIDPATGVATAVTHGVTTIVASSGGVAGNATLTVDLSGSVATVVVSPPRATLTARLAQQQFTAVAQDANGAVVPGIVFAWSSSIPAVATIDQNGRASALGRGVTTIAATVGSVSGTATLAVHAH